MRYPRRPPPSPGSRSPDAPTCSSTTRGRPCSTTWSRASTRCRGRRGSDVRWLIVGPYVPERGSGPDAAAAFVAERLAAGDTVHVVSPRPTAAHVHHALDGLAGIQALWQIARAQSCDGLWLRVESGLVLHAHTDSRRALVALALPAILPRRLHQPILDLATVCTLPRPRVAPPVHLLRPHPSP